MATTSDNSSDAKIAPEPKIEMKIYEAHIVDAIKADPEARHWLHEHYFVSTLNQMRIYTIQLNRLFQEYGSGKYDGDNEDFLLARKCWGAVYERIIFLRLTMHKLFDRPLVNLHHLMPDHMIYNVLLNKEDFAKYGDHKSIKSFRDGLPEGCIERLGFEKDLGEIPTAPVDEQEEEEETVCESDEDLDNDQLREKYGTKRVEKK